MTDNNQARNTKRGQSTHAPEIVQDKGNQLPPRQAVTDEVETLEILRG